MGSDKILVAIGSVLDLYNCSRLYTKVYCNKSMFVMVAFAAETGAEGWWLVHLVVCICMEGEHTQHSPLFGGRN